MLGAHLSSGDSTDVVITVDTDKKVYAASEPVKITVNLTNAGSEAVTLHFSGPGIYYIVTNATTFATVYNYYIHADWLWAFWDRTIAPGETWSTSFDFDPAWWAQEYDNGTSVPVQEYYRIWGASAGWPSVNQGSTVVLIGTPTEPLASFVPSSDEVDVGETVVVDASTSLGVDGTSSGLEYRWDWDGDGTWDTDWNSTQTAENTYLAPGNYTIWLEVKDMAGLTGRTSTVVRATNVDALPPVTTCPVIGGNGTEEWFNYNVTVFLEATDDSGFVSETLIRIDNDTWQTFNEYYVMSGDGIHTIDYYSIDGAGNIEDVKSRMFKIDTEAPVLAIIWPGNDTTGGGRSVTVGWFCEDNMSGIDHFEVMIDGGGVVGYSEWYRSVNLENVRGGTHHVWIRAWDAAGNTAVVEVTFQVKDESGPFWAFVVIGALVICSTVALVVFALRGTKQRGRIGE